MLFKIVRESNNWSTIILSVIITLIFAVPSRILLYICIFEMVLRAPATAIHDTDGADEIRKQSIVPLVFGQASHLATIFQNLVKNPS